MTRSFTILMILTLTITLLQAAYIQDQPQQIMQPDGTVINCLASGDEFFNYLHDAAGYTIIQDADGWYYYAVQDAGDVVPSRYVVGQIEPSTTGLQPYAKISRETYLQRKARMEEHISNTTRVPTIGSFNNLVVYIRFADQTEFADPRSFFWDKFNAEGETAESVKAYYDEVSYNQLALESYHYPESAMNTNLSYQDSHTRDYFMPYNATTNPNGYQGDYQRAQREHQLLADAVAAIESEVPDTLDIDVDDDGYVDSMCFIIRGSSAGWADLLWAHSWVLYSQNVYLNGKQVYRFTFQPENQNDVMTLCHEMFHLLGAPDLYHYSNGGSDPNGPYSSWDIMNGANTHMSAYMKEYYGNWITIPEITETGTYWLKPLSTNQEHNSYRIPSPNSSSEYFIIEYRRKIPNTFDYYCPGSGITVSRVNGALSGSGNASGPPDELYLYRPGGTISNSGNVLAAHFSADMGRTTFGDATNPADWLSNGQLGGIMIRNISAVGDSISFDLNPELGTLTGLITSTDPNADLTLATIHIGEESFTPQADGSFTLDFWSGTYNATVEMPGHGTQDQEVIIQPGGATYVQFDLQFLSIPQNLDYTLSGNDVILNWDFDDLANPDFEDFAVQVSLAGGQYNQIGTTTELTYTRTVAPVMSYNFRVIASYSNGISLPSNEVTVSFTSADPPTPEAEQTKLYTNYPNPFNPSTTIYYQLGMDGPVALEIYNVKGQKIKTLVNRNESSGYHSVIWDGSDESGQQVASGLYLYKLRTIKMVKTKKMMLLD